MNQIRDSLAQLSTKSGFDLGFSLHAQASLVQEYSNDPDHPNVSAYLRSGAVEMIGRVEDESYNAALTDVLNLLDQQRRSQSELRGLLADLRR